MKIAAALCVRNEEWILPRTLDVLSVFCDRIFILDDNSNDKTKEICLSYDKVDYEDWNKRDNMHIRQEGLRKQRNIDRVSSYNPDYVLFVDADEIPSPSIIEFFDNIDPEVNLWTLPWYHLWKDEDHYRTDSFVTSTGARISFGPHDGGQRKGFIMKHDSNIHYKFDTNLHKSVPMEPMNIPSPHSTTEEVAIIHYGRISKFHVSGDKNKYYSKVESDCENQSYESRMLHHEMCNAEDTLTLEKLPQQLKDWSSFGITTKVDYDNEVIV